MWHSPAAAVAGCVLRCVLQCLALRLRLALQLMQINVSNWLCCSGHRWRMQWCQPKACVLQVWKEPSLAALLLVLPASTQLHACFSCCCDLCLLIGFNGLMFAIHCYAKLLCSSNQQVAVCCQCRTIFQTPTRRLVQLEPSPALFVTAAVTVRAPLLWRLLACGIDSL